MSRLSSPEKTDCPRLLDGSDNVGFSITVANNPAHQFITATAPRIPGANAEQTSEFALNIPITSSVVDAMFANGFE